MYRFMFALVSLTISRQSLAEPDTLLGGVTSRCDLAVDGGLVVGFPTALPTGLATGIGAGITQGRTFTIGARVAWVSAEESTMAWAVTHADLRLRVTGGVQHEAGRGRFGLRLGLGGTLVHESRSRNQGARAGLEGDELATSAYAMLPALDVEAVVVLGIAGPWAMVVNGGPSVALLDGNARASWSAQLGVAWRP